MTLHPLIDKITTRIQDRSRKTRTAYLDKIRRSGENRPTRSQLPCGNLAHGFAVCSKADKQALAENKIPNLAIVSADNDMLSAHAPYVDYPAIIKHSAQAAGGVAQFAGGVPAMCDGITQGQSGIELSLFSRDVIALSTTIALSHNMFDGILCLGICDKIVPGMLIGALSFGHLPTAFIPAGPMISGLPNAEKILIRQRYAEGKADRKTLLLAESQSYHSPGTCTFYGTANSNQMLMEMMGLQLPGSSFVNPNTALRDALTMHAVKKLTTLIITGNAVSLGEIVNEKSLVNAMVGLLATGGSTNHTLHLLAIARADGVLLCWDDLEDLSAIIPLLCRIYPNGEADVNHFHAAGGMAFLIRELRQAGLLHDDVATILGNTGLAPYCENPQFDDNNLVWQTCNKQSFNDTVLRSLSKPFKLNGGLKILIGNLGRAVIKISALRPEHRYVKAPAKAFDNQDDLVTQFKAGKLNQDFIAVVRFQGPKANGMPELHKLTPVLSVLQDRGYHVGLVTDGRMSGASGKIPAAIHLTPECMDGAPLSYVQENDIIEINASSGRLFLEISPETLASRPTVNIANAADHDGTGRELFALFRENVSTAEEGATIFKWEKQL